jgi:lipid II:glycine glycyltransferase (peptidoglycan interpeptide bridge formation enzyme)
MTRVPRLDEPAAWDAFVAANGLGSYLQRTAWARVKAANGWTSTRIVVGGATPIGAQVLLRRPRPLPWAFAYAPRGPVAAAWTAGSLGAFTEAVRSAPLGRVSHLRIDPEVERDGPLDPGGALRVILAGAGWRPAPAIQPPSTRLIDLGADEAALWGDLRGKWRQYVNKARSAGVTVAELPGDPIGPFYAIYRETASRAGFLIRVEQAYRDVWEAYRPTGDATILFAIDADGAPQAALFLVRNGLRVVEPYGGMTLAGGTLRANYLLKWEAIRRAREGGAATYDLWGLAHPGIAHFKTGFGGREVRFIGAWDLVLSSLGREVYQRAQGLRVRRARRHAGLAAAGAPGLSGANDPGAGGTGADADAG